MRYLRRINSRRPAGTTDLARSSARIRILRLLVVAVAGLTLGFTAFSAYGAVQPRRTTPVYDPPVLAGQGIPGYCSGGYYARLGDTIVLTTSPHCGGEGTVVRGPDEATVQGVIGPTARDATCQYPDHTCASSDLNYLVVAADRIPWGHLNLIDLGVAGYRALGPDTAPLSCADVAVGDRVEIDGRGIYRDGTVIQKGENLFPAASDGSYFPCMIIAHVPVGGGDSGGAVLVRGIPAGITSRRFDGWLGFTPLAEGLSQLGLDLCTTPDCGLTPPVRP